MGYYSTCHVYIGWDTLWSYYISTCIGLVWYSVGLPIARYNKGLPEVWFSIGLPIVCYSIGFPVFFLVQCGPPIV